MAEEGFISVAEAREMLRRVYRSDGEINPRSVLRRAASDPIKPVSESGRMRPSLFVIVTGVTVLLLVAGFVYFSFGGKG